jgi:phage tail sheath gpL-like
MSSPNISFNQIGAARMPGVYAEFNTRVGSKNLPGNRQRTLLVGQKTAAGTLAPLRVTDIFSEADAALQCGYGSQLHRMVLKALMANPYAVLSVVALDDLGGGVAATWTATVAGAPTAGGQWVLALNDDTIAVNVATTDTPTTVAAAFVAAITTKRELPFTASAVAGVVTITAKNKGTVANSAKVAASGTVAGMTFVAATGVVGASDPDMSTALQAAFLGGHDQIVSPYRDAPNLVVLRNHLDAVGSAFEKRWAHGYIGSNGSLATATALSGTLNHGWINHVWLRNTTTTPHEIAAAYAAVVAGSEDPATPMNNVEVKGVAVPLVADRTSRTEIETVLYNGVTPLAVGPGDKVQIVRAITTYTLNDAAAPDPTLLELATTRTLKYVAKVFIADRAIRYSRAKISQRVINSIRDSGIVLLKLLEDLEIIENVSANLPQYIVERDTQDPNRINERIPTDVVSGLHVLAERFDLIV